jgi:hypothetical protein
VQSHAHGTLAHRKFQSGRLDRVALYGDRLQHLAPTLWQALEMHGHLAGPNRLRDGFAADGFREIVDIDEDAPATPAQRTDQLLRAIANNHGKNRVSASQICLCVPKTLSELMPLGNHLIWRNDWAALFRSDRPGLAIQVEGAT